MEDLAARKRVARFGAFEFDLRTGEVRKNGMKRQLCGQPFQVLAILLENAEELVERETLRKRLWPQDTYVDFDHSLRVAINKVREALGDSADSPRFVETLRGRGYRFIAPVRWENGGRPSEADDSRDSGLAARDSGSGARDSGHHELGGSETAAAEHAQGRQDAGGTGPARHSGTGNRDSGEGEGTSEGFRGVMAAGASDRNPLTPMPSPPKGRGEDSHISSSYGIREAQNPSPMQANADSHNATETFTPPFTFARNPSPKPRIPSRLRQWPLLVVLAVSVLMASMGMFWLLIRRPVPLHRLQQIRLTAGLANWPVYSTAISPDGKYLGYSDQHGIHLQSFEPRESQTAPFPPGFQAGHSIWKLESWYPGSARFLASLTVPGETGSLWSVPILGGEPRELTGAFNGDAAVSPDGSSVVFSRGLGALGAREIWLMGPDGESPHKILSAGARSRFGRVVWSPASGRIAYELLRQEQDRRYSHSIETCDVGGGERRTITLHQTTLDWSKSEFIWIPPGRFIFRRDTEDGGFTQENLWDLSVDARTGVPKGKPRRLTDWSGFSVKDLSATADGKTIMLRRGSNHWPILVGELPASGNRLRRLRRLTIDQYLNLPFAWTPDSRWVIFLSNHNGSWGIYKQRIGGARPEVITAPASLDADEPRLSPDGAWAVFPARPHSAPPGALTRMYRAPLTGGPPTPLFELQRFIVMYCASGAAGFCAYASHSPDQRTMIITGFDAVAGYQKELLRISTDPGADYHWSLSPDGSQVAVLKNDWRANEIHLIPLTSRLRAESSAGSVQPQLGSRRTPPVPRTRTLAVKGYANIDSLDWAADSKSVFVGASGPKGATLLRVWLNGKLQPVWHQPQGTQIWGIASPNGRYVAIHADRVEADVWTLSNF